MDEIILRLRKLSIRWAMVIMFGMTIITGLMSFKDGSGTVALTAVVTAIGAILFYGTWSAHAIADISKVKITLYILIAAILINMVGQWNTLNETVDFEGAVTDSIFGDETAMNNLIYSRAVSSYPTQLIQILLSAGAFIYALRWVDKRFRFCWISQIVLYGICLLSLGLLIRDSGNFNLYKDLTNIITWLSAIVYIIIFVQGNNNTRVANQTQSTIATPPTSYPVTEPHKTSFEDKTKNLLKLKELLDAGVLSQEEFDTEKSKILNR